MCFFVQKPQKKLKNENFSPHVLNQLSHMHIHMHTHIWLSENFLFVVNGSLWLAPWPIKRSCMSFGSFMMAGTFIDTFKIKCTCKLPETFKQKTDLLIT